MSPDLSTIRPLTRLALDRLGHAESRATEALSRWIDTVSRWNARIDLTAARTPEELVDLLVADAVVLSSELSEESRVVDVGTGAGAPGLGLAILRPDLEVTLVEPLTKRVALLRTVIGAGLHRNAIVVRGKGEDAGTGFDVAVSRATLPPPEWAQLGKRLGKRVVVFLAQGEPPPGTWVVDRRYTWPLTGASRRVLVGTPA